MKYIIKTICYQVGFEIFTVECKLKIFMLNIRMCMLQTYFQNTELFKFLSPKTNKKKINETFSESVVFKLIIKK